MSSWSLTFLIIALLAALLGFGEGDATAAWLANAIFGVALALFLASLLPSRRRREHEPAGRSQKH